VLHAAFSPDGRRIVTTSTDKTTRIWNAADGRQLMTLSGHADVVESAAFSPDGSRIVTASDDKTARIWDAASGRQIMVLSGHSDIVGSAAFSPDGRRIVTASYDKTARIWDAATGEQLEVLSGHTDLVEAALFSPDGQRVVTASDDLTARIWDARTEAVKAQIAWAAAAQFDPLNDTERFQLGLPAPPDVRQWPRDATACDQAAAAPYDPERRAPGVSAEQIVPGIAVAACAGTTAGSAGAARALYQHGRALMAGGDWSAARRDLEQAVARGYASARIDLALLLLQPAGGMLDPAKAVALDETAWNDGVRVAAFELGRLYERGVPLAGAQSGFLVAPDPARAWSWYQRAADAGEPNALARFAEREDSRASAVGPTLLAAFKYYAAAAERARQEDWPTETWRDWRYRRASLARILAHAGMTGEVVRVYEAVRAQYAVPR
jgi:TPR repeat protein